MASQLGMLIGQLQFVSYPRKSIHKEQMTPEMEGHQARYVQVLGRAGHDSMELLISR